MTWKCTLCNISFTKEIYFDFHHRTVHKNFKSHFCDQCPRGFYDVEDLNNHVSTVHLSKDPIHVDVAPPHKYQCKLCGVLHLSEKNLTQHMEHHDKERTKAEINVSFRCQLCHKVFKTGIILNQHRRHIHNLDVLPFPKPSSKKRPVACEICGKTYTSNKRFIVHVRKMHPSLPVGSELTGTSIPSIIAPSGVPSTSTTPSGVPSTSTNVEAKMSWKCTLCNMSFEKERDLDYHHRTVHKNFKAHYCHECGRGFFDSNDLSNHVSTVHLPKDDNDLDCAPPHKYLCQLCGALHKSGTSFTQHMKYHYTQILRAQDNGFVPCEVCHKLYKSRKSLNLHRQNIHNLHSLSLAKSSPKKKTVSCESCGRGFTSNSYLILHVRKMHPSLSVKSVLTGTSFPIIIAPSGVPFNSTIAEGSGVHHPKLPIYSTDVAACLLPNPYIRLGPNLVGARANTSNTDEPGIKLPWICTVCDKGFQTQAYLARHMDFHNQQNTLSLTPKHEICCTLCGKGYHNETNLKRHMKLSHSTNGDKLPDNQTFTISVTCTECEMLLTNRRQVWAHLKRFHPEHAVYNSSAVAINFLTANDVNIRKRLPKQICLIPNDYTSDCALLYAFSSNPKVFFCLNVLRCYKDFNGNPWTCSVCSLQFSNLAFAIKHEVMLCKVPWSSVELDFMSVFFFHCPNCNDQFTSVTDLTRHQQRKCMATSIESHALKLYQCPVCLKRFLTYAGMKVHIKKGHPPSNVKIYGKDEMGNPFLRNQKPDDVLYTNNGGLHTVFAFPIMTTKRQFKLVIGRTSAYDVARTAYQNVMQCIRALRHPSRHDLDRLCQGCSLRNHIEAGCVTFPDLAFRLTHPIQGTRRAGKFKFLLRRLKGFGYVLNPTECASKILRHCGNPMMQRMLQVKPLFKPSPEMLARTRHICKNWNGRSSGQKRYVELHRHQTPHH